MRLFYICFFVHFNLVFCFSQSNLPDWIAARPSPASIGYIASVIIPTSWPIGPGGGILLELPQSYDGNDNVIIEVYDNQMPRVLRNTFSAQVHMGAFPLQLVEYF